MTLSLTRKLAGSIWFSLLITTCIMLGSSKSYSDNKTGLTWQFCSAGMTSIPWGCVSEPLLQNWNQALNYCTRLDEGNHHWRLPTRNELLTLVNWRQRAPATNAELVASTKNNFYWSSTSSPDDPAKAFYTSMLSGYSYANYKKAQGYVRCIKVFS